MAIPVSADEAIVGAYDTTNAAFKVNLTVDTVTVDITGDSTDLDSGAGTDNHEVFAIGVAASGGHAVITGDVTNGLDVDVTRLPALVAGSAVIGKVAIDQTTPGTTNLVDTELMAAAALADAASATPTTPSVGAVPLLMNATTLDRQRAVVNTLDSTGTGIAAAGIVGQLDDAATTAVTENQFAPVRISSRRALLVEGVASGTTIPVTAAQSIAASLKAEVVGPVADDGVAANPPELIAGVAVDMDGTAPGVVSAEGDISQLRTATDRILLVNASHPRYVGSNTNYAAAQTNTALISAPGANLSIWITDIIMSADTAGNIKIVESTGASPATVAGPYYFTANGGLAISLRNPIKLTANKDLGVTSVNSGNHSITVRGYIAA